MISRMNRSAIPSTSSRPKKRRSEMAKTGMENIANTAVDQTARSIPVADLEHLCRHERKVIDLILTCTW